MLIIYDSLTGQTKRFATKLGYDMMHIKLYEGVPQDDIFLLTRSFNFGQIPDTTLRFLDKYGALVVGCAVSGNRNWGTNYGKAGEKIQTLYNIPLVLKFEASGLIEDHETVKDWIKNYIKEKRL